LKDFAYIVSHDLKAPLRGIKTLADWISTDYADKIDEKGKEQMGLLLTRVGRMHNLINGVLQYSRVGRVREKKVKADLNELLPEVIDMVAPPENIEVTVEGRLPVIECEKTGVIHIFENLLSNAIKYMDKPRGQIRIGCVEDEVFWKFSVGDNGPGIEEKYFDKIFRIFQTLSARDDFESTGVGLSVVKKIVALSGGRIWVESEPGRGSTFYFTLPKSKREVSDAKPKLKADIAC
jgi:light-regulated signal transduction histidine kinase (bacteriophytochrome)